MNKKLLGILFFLTLSHSAFAEHWQSCNSCSDSQKISAAKSFAPNYTGSVTVYIPDYDTQSVQTYQVSSIVEEEPGSNFSRVIVNQKDTPVEVTEASNTAYQFAKTIREVSSEDLGLYYQTSAWLINSNNQGTTMNKLSIKLNSSFSSRWNANSSVLMRGALLSAAKGTEIRVTFPDSSYVKFKLTGINNIMDANGLTEGNGYGFEFSLAGGVDSLHQQIPTSASALNGLGATASQGENMGAWVKAFQMLNVVQVWTNNGPNYQNTCQYTNKQMTCTAKGIN